MSRSELTRDVLRPLVEKNLKAKQIAHELGVAEITVKKALKRHKLRKKDLDAYVHMHRKNNTAFAKSSDPVLKMGLTVPQASAVVDLRNVLHDTCGLRGQNILQMLLARGGGFGPKNDDAPSFTSDLRRKHRAWIMACKAKEIDYRPALDIAGMGLPIRHVGQTLGIGVRRARTACLKALDLYATMQGWQKSARPRRSVWKGPQVDASEYAPLPEKYTLKPIGEPSSNN